MRALVVDDHRLTRKYVREILLQEGVFEAVEEAEDGLAALERLRKERFDLVVSDIAMPRMGGLALLAEAKAQAPELAFIVLSAMPEAEYGRRALDLGASAFLSKGCPPERIAEAALRAFGGSLG